MKTMFARSRRPPAAQGFALIEVLVSLVIFSLGVVGLVAMQARALQVGTDAQDRTRAAQLAQSLSSEMWVMKSTSLESGALDAWQKEVAASLPQGTGSVTQNTAGMDATIAITWQAPVRKQRSAAQSETNQFVTQVVIPQ